MLTMQNVKSFLQDGKFIDPQEAILQNTENANIIHIVRQSKRFNKKIKFVVVSNVEKFFVKPQYWDRVVAVFTTGQEWQFKNYQVNQPNLLFQKVKGFYVNYSGDIVPQNVQNWNVQVISLERNQRFKDRQISEYLWESIERFMLSKGYK
jgi:parafibromin